MILLALSMLCLVLLLFLFLYMIVSLILKSNLAVAKTIILFCLVLFLYAGYTKIRYTLIIPAIHFIFQPDDYDEPLIFDEFIFHEKGYSKTYSLPYKYPQIQAIKLTRGKNDLSNIDNLTGILKAEFFYKDQLLFEKVTTDFDDCLRNRTVYLIKFAMPLNNKYKKHISLRLTVLEPYLELEKFDTLFIEVGTVGY